MNVRGATGVVAGKDGVKLEDAVLVAELDAAEHGVVDVAGIGRVSIATSDHTAVDACAVAVPCLKSNLRNRLAGRGIDELDVESQWYSSIAISDVLADIFARDP